MKKKITSLLCAAAMCGTATAAVCPTAAAQTDTGASDVTVLAYEPFGTMDIRTAGTLSTTDEWAYNMMYDTLLEMTADGKWQPSILESWEWASEEDMPENTLRQACAYSVKNSLATSYTGGIAGDLPDLPQNPTYPVFMDGCGFESPFPIDGWNDFLTGEGRPVLRMKVRENLTFSDGYDINAQTITEWIDYAKSAGSNTAIYKQWRPVVQTYMEDDYTFLIELSFAGLNYKFADFMYNLTTPAASIAHIDEEGNVSGSGSYGLDYVGETESGLPVARLKKRGSTDTVSFVVVQDDTEREMIYQVGEGDIAILNGNSSVTVPEENIGKTNPIIAFYNTNSEKMSNIALRKACNYAIDNEAIIDLNGLSFESNTVWKLGSYYNSETFPLDVAADWLTQYKSETGITDEFVTVTLHHDGTELGRNISTKIGENLATAGIICDIYGGDILPDEDFNGVYDIELKEVDLRNVNSVYNAFKGYESGNDADFTYLLDRADSAANVGSYCRSYYEVQQYCFNNMSYMTYFGYKNMRVAVQSGVSGLYMPQGVFPLGDMDRLDFRNVVKTV